MKLSRKIFLTFFISVTGLLAATLYLVDTRAEQHEIERITSSLDKTQAQFQHDLDIQQQQIQTLTHIITTDQKFRSFLAQIKDNFYPFVEEIGKDTLADAVFMLDDELKTRAVFLADQQATLAIEEMPDSGARQSLDSVTMISAMISLNTGLYSSHFIPLKENLNDDYAVGLIVVCQQINNSWMNRLLANETALLTVFFNQDQIVASNTDNDLASALLAQTSMQQSQLFLWHGERYIIKRIPLNEAKTAGYFLGANLDQVLLPFYQLQRQLLFMGSGILCFGALLFLIVSQRITRPLRLITEGTLEIGHGNYQHRIEYQNPDEVGQLATAFNTMASELQEKELIRSTFSRYVDPAIVSELLSQPEKLRLGGERKKQSVLFSDIAGFTEFSEQIDAEALISILNAYLSAMTIEISQHQGILDKFIGDAIMAFWSPELCNDQPAIHACHSALAMQKKLLELRPVWLANGAPEIHCRIGIATGYMIVGNIGSEHARSYTCIGDKVNYSSRLEGLNKYYGTQIIVDQQTVLEVSGFTTRELDTVRVKGRNSGEAIFELIGLQSEITEKQLDMISRYQRALDLYRQRHFDAAIAIFSTMPDDPPSQILLSRCMHLLKQIDPHWDGVHVMSDK